MRLLTPRSATYLALVAAGLALIILAAVVAARVSSGPADAESGPSPPPQGALGQAPPATSPRSTAPSEPAVPEFPDAAATGWRHTDVSLEPYQGPEVIETAGTVIDGKDLGCVWIQAPDVVIMRSRIRCGGPFPVRVHDQGNLLIEDTEIDGLGNVDSSCITWEHYTARRVDCHGVGDGMYIAGDDVVIEDSYIHGLVTCDDCHTDSIQSTGGSRIVIRGNTIENPYQQTGVIKLGAEDGSLHDVLVEGNLLNGGGFTVYGGGVEGDISGIRFLDNRFMRAPDGFHSEGGYWGPVSYFEPSLPGNEWSGNVWDDTGDPVNP
jgi:hypothetical protein